MTTSPTFRKPSGKGWIEAPIPAGVPVAITSPGSRVKASERWETCSKQSKTISDVFPSWRFSSLTKVRIPSCCGSAISSPVTSQGPSGPWVSNDFPIVIVGARICQSRTETSLAIV